VAVDAYDYLLPEEAIAQHPLEPRHDARLLVASDLDGGVDHRRVADLPALVREGDLVVVNDTRVMPSRLVLAKPTGGRVEVLLLEQLPDGSWEALVRPGRRVPPGTPLVEAAPRARSEGGQTPHGPAVAVVGDHIGDGRRRVRLLEPALAERMGSLALPPYIHEPLADPERYQTVYSRNPGSVAAPTAGLHLSEQVLEGCRRAGAAVATVDLSVGLDTFRPITAARPEDHVIHSEAYSVPEETWSAVSRATRVIAVGTTTVRALESAAATGQRAGRTSLFIRPGYRFEVVDLLLTNFHLPRSSLLLLLAAFCGPRWQDIYQAALRDGYRFLSFGDAMLVARDAGVPAGTPSCKPVGQE
jgi:S-adenosylmethionine:tRNA ribosyltransferase-isomerase